MVEEVVYDSGEAICKTGEDGDTMFGIIEGEVRVHRGSETLAVLGVGQCFGEMAIIDGGRGSEVCGLYGASAHDSPAADKRTGLHVLLPADKRTKEHDARLG
jgi:CRP-like cAMP-binding protein